MAWCTQHTEIDFGQSIWDKFDGKIRCICSTGLAPINSQPNWAIQKCIKITNDLEFNNRQSKIDSFSLFIIERLSPDV